MRSLTASLVLALVLCLAGTASARPIEGDTAPWRDAGAAPQSPVIVDAHWRSAAAPQSPVVADAHWRAPAVSDVAATPADDVLPAPDGGLSAFIIVLICAGGVLLLGAAAITTTRVVAHRATH